MLSLTHPRRAVVVSLGLMLLVAVVAAALRWTASDPSAGLQPHTAEDAHAEGADDAVTGPHPSIEAGTAPLPTQVTEPPPSPDRSPQSPAAASPHAHANPPAPSEETCAVPLDVERISDLRATPDVGCATAATVAAAYDHQAVAGQTWPGNEPISADGYLCTTQPAGPTHEETFGVHCTRHHQTVRFLWGV